MEAREKLIHSIYSALGSIRDRPSRVRWYARKTSINLADLEELWGALDHDFQDWIHNANPAIFFIMDPTYLAILKYLSIKDEEGIHIYIQSLVDHILS